MVLLYVSIMVVISMAIIIPSRNIYDKNHNKIRDNVIDNVEIDGSEVVPDNKYDEAVYSKQFETKSNILGLTYKDVRGSVQNNISAMARGEWWAYKEIQAKYDEYTIEIPKELENAYISNINKSKINANIRYVEIVENATATIYDTKSTNANMYVSPLTGEIKDFIYEGLTSSTNSSALSPSKDFTYSSTIDTSGQIKFTGSVTTDTGFENLENISGYIDYNENYDLYSFKIKVLTSYTTIELGGDLTYFVDESGGGNPHTLQVNGERKTYTPQFAEITIYGNTIGIDLVDKTVKIGSGNHPFSIGGSNELLQTSNYIDTVQHKAIDTDYNNTLNKYSNGKETATILCSISDYYDENKNKVIAIDNANKMCFRMYDIVEPYVFGANGQDKPLSKNKDGSPKQFQVLGVKPIYDGAVWQELTLQEV